METIQPPQRPYVPKRRIGVSPTVRARAKYLLPAEYHTAQLATELGLDRREAWRIREWCRRGLSHRHDETGHVLINGDNVKAWVETTCTRRKRELLPEGQMWCCACRCPRLATRVRIVRTANRARKVATCPLGHPMSQWVSSRELEQ
jgi:hypothetical protein